MANRHFAALRSAAEKSISLKAALVDDNYFDTQGMVIDADKVRKPSAGTVQSAL